MKSATVNAGLCRFRLEFTADGKPLHEVSLDKGDFAPAVEGAFFDGLRRGLFRDYDPPLGEARLEPRFADKAGGSPRTRGFRVVLPTPTGREHRVDFGTRFFASKARLAVAELVREGKVTESTVLHFHLAGYLDEEVHDESGPRFLLEPASVVVPIRSGSRTGFGRTATWDHPLAGDMPVLIPRYVLEEVVDEARQAPEREVGGVLLGHLRRDAVSGEIFLEITCQVPAEETQATGTSVTFTSATWARAREVVEVRGEGEIVAGWVHSHPFRFCAECPLPTPAECIGKVMFYSSDDEFLMSLTFPRPFMVGLLAGVEPKLEQALGHLPVRLYGWRNGEIHARGFEVIEG